MIQGPALEDEIVPGQGDARGGTDLVRDLIVMREVVFAAPAIEAKGMGRLRSGPEDRTGIA